MYKGTIVGCIRIMKKVLVFALVVFHANAIASVPAPPDFSTAQTYGVDLSKYCKKKFGSGVVAVANGAHAYDWVCNRATGTTAGGVSVAVACTQQYGSAARPILVGNGKNDWKCIKWSLADYYVSPVVIVASEYAYDYAKVDAAISSVIQVTRSVKDWYDSNTLDGKTFRLMQPQIHLSARTKAQWREDSCISSVPAERPSQCAAYTSYSSNLRDQFYHNALAEVQSRYSSVPGSSHLIVPIFVYTGPDSAPYFLGANGGSWPVTGGGIRYNVQAPNVASCTSANPYCGMFGFGHELGHNLGLKHPCSDYSPQPAGCYSSIMEASEPPNAVLLYKEQKMLTQSLFLF